MHRDSERGRNQGGSLAQLNRASDYGSEGYRFESCGSHQAIYPTDHLLTIVQVVFFIRATDGLLVSDGREAL